MQMFYQNAHETFSTNQHRDCLIKFARIISSEAAFAGLLFYTRLTAEATDAKYMKCMKPIARAMLLHTPKTGSAL